LQSIDFSAISGIMIDIDDTLYGYSECNFSAIKACYESIVSNNLIKNIKFDEFKDLYVLNRSKITKQLHPQGSCRSRLFAFDRLFCELDIPHPHLMAKKYEDLYWNTFLEKMKVSKEMSTFIKKAKNHGLIICAVTDMQASFQIAKLKKLELSEQIDFLATSEEAGAEKPNKKIFRLALKKMKLNKDQVVMIGDSILKDIKGAESFGIKAIYFKA